MNFKQLNGNETIKFSTVADWVFRILSLTLLVAIPLMLNFVLLEHRVTIVESTHFSSTKGNDLKNKVVRLEEKCKGYEKELADLKKQIDRLEGRK
jgi:hypothetical protein